VKAFLSGAEVERQRITNLKTLEVVLIKRLTVQIKLKVCMYPNTVPQMSSWLI